MVWRLTCEDDGCGWANLHRVAPTEAAAVRPFPACPICGGPLRVETRDDQQRARARRR